MIAAYVLQDLAEVKQVTLHYTAFKPTDKGWSVVEQERFWEALTHYPKGPWTSVAAYIGTKTTRQAMTHAQKLRQKLDRWKKKRASLQQAAVAATSLGDHLQLGIANSPSSPSSSCSDSMMPAITDASANLDWLFAFPQVHAPVAIKTEVTSPVLTACSSPQQVNDVSLNEPLDDDFLASTVWDKFELPQELDCDLVFNADDLLL